ncbi:hypothetical protein K1719_009837 [Acacia pycnantha]|nr:hypothetical protein K1719_009837 [Acacia pycnantha]
MAYLPSCLQHHLNYLFDCSITVVFMFQNISIHWKLRDSVTVIQGHQNHFLLHFHHRLDRVFFFNRGFLCFFSPWVPDLQITGLYITHMSIWIAFQGLPLNYYNEAAAPFLAKPFHT